MNQQVEVRLPDRRDSLGNSPLRPVAGFGQDQLVLRSILALLVLGFIWFVTLVAFRFPFIFVPTWLILAAAATCGGAVVAWWILRRRTSVVRLIVFVALFAANLASLAPFQSSPINRFKTAYQSIHTGMSSDEVMAILDHQFPAKNPIIEIKSENAVYVTLGSDDPEFNAETFKVFLKNGQVVSKDYSPD